MKYLPYIIITLVLIVIAILILRENQSPVSSDTGDWFKITDITPRDAAIHSLDKNIMVITVEHDLQTSKTWAIDQSEVPEDTKVGDYLHITYDPQNPKSTDLVRKNLKLDIKKGEE